MTEDAKSQAVCFTSAHKLECPLTFLLRSIESQLKIEKKAIKRSAGDWSHRYAPFEKVGERLTHWCFNLKQQGYVVPEIGKNIIPPVLSVGNVVNNAAHAPIVTTDTTLVSAAPDINVTTPGILAIPPPIQIFVQEALRQAMEPQMKQMQEMQKNLLDEAAQQFLDNDDNQEEVMEAAVERFLDNGDNHEELLQAAAKEYLDDDDCGHDEILEAAAKLYVNDADNLNSVLQAAAEQYLDDDDNKDKVLEAAAKQYLGNESNHDEVLLAAAKLYLEDNGNKGELLEAAAKLYPGNENKYKKIKNKSLVCYHNENDLKPHPKRAKREDVHHK